MAKIVDEGDTRYWTPLSTPPIAWNDTPHYFTSSMADASGNNNSVSGQGGWLFCERPKSRHPHGPDRQMVL